jgi:hypothetical protein
VLIWLTQIAWIPFWAAGVINGIGHYWGYRNWATPDASTNIVPLGILIGGEELHNNHHAYPTSAKLSSKWYEFDLGWLYIRALEALGLARVKHLAPVPRIEAPKSAADLRLLQAVILNRYDVLARFARSLKRGTQCASAWTQCCPSRQSSAQWSGCGASSPACGHARRPRASSWSGSCRTGASAPRRAASRRWPSCRGAFAATHS